MNAQQFLLMVQQLHQATPTDQVTARLFRYGEDALKGVVVVNAGTTLGGRLCVDTARWHVAKRHRKNFETLAPGILWRQVNPEGPNLGDCVTKWLRSRSDIHRLDRPNVKLEHWPLSDSQVA